MSSAQPIPASASLAGFARVLGSGKSYVTKLKQQDRLVFLPTGLVDVPASLERIRASSRAVERAAAPVQGVNYADAAERDKHYSAELRRLEYEQRSGALLAACVTA